MSDLPPGLVAQADQDIAAFQEFIARGVELMLKFPDALTGIRSMVSAMMFREEPISNERLMIALAVAVSMMVEDKRGKS